MARETLALDFLCGIDFGEGVSPRVEFFMQNPNPGEEEEATYSFVVKSLSKNQINSIIGSLLQSGLLSVDVDSPPGGGNGGWKVGLPPRG